TAAGSSQVFVCLQASSRAGPGPFGPSQILFGSVPDYQLGVSRNPSDLALFDVDGDHRLDIVVVSQFSNLVSVLLNTPTAPFATELRFRAGTGLSQIDASHGAWTLSARDAPAGMAFGDFDGDQVNDLIVTQSGSNRFSLLRGSGFGGFANAQSPPT